MFGAVPASLILQMMKDDGYMEQLPLFETPPELNIREEYLTSLDIELDVAITPAGGRHRLLSSIDHPGFTAIRDYLAGTGHINKVTNYSNGDSVLKSFYLNGVYFEEGDQFPCASAMKNKLK
jgi:hypothetical protein